LIVLVAKGKEKESNQKSKKDQGSCMDYFVHEPFLK
jgi:hypothetical protein